MSSILGELGSVAANTAGETIAFAAGTAGNRALSPISEAVAQKAWETAPIRLPAAEFLAVGVAQGQVDPAEAEAWAKKQGIGSAAWKAMVDIANVGPALGYAYQALRRGFLTEDQFNTALKRTGLEEQWYAAMRDLKDNLLEPGQLSTAIHRGIIAGQGLLVTEPPQTPGKVPFVPQSTIDGIKEGAGQGYDPERLRVLVGITGLPLSLGEMLQLLNRGEVTEDDVRRAVAESNVRNEYMEVALALRRRLLTPHEYTELALRGWITTEQMHAGALMSGMQPDDADLLFKMLGRPLNVHAVTTGLARGGKYGGDYEGVPDPYQTALRQSNVRPEWGNLAYANRYTLPSAFVLRTLAQAGELSHDEVHLLLLQIGWPPELVDKVAAMWTGGTTGKVDKNVTKAETSAWTAAQKSYIGEMSTEQDVQPIFTALGIDNESQSQIVNLWNEVRALTRSQLSPTQVKKAIGQPGKDQAWALQQLHDRGWDNDDATTFLNE